MYIKKFTRISAKTNPDMGIIHDLYIVDQYYGWSSQTASIVVMKLLSIVKHELIVLMKSTSVVVWYSSFYGYLSDEQIE